MESGENPTRLITNFTAELRALNPETDLNVILVGSVARGTETLQSDLDLLVVSDAEARLPAPGGRLHVQSFTEEAFRAKLRSGDDFAAWCVRFGVPLVSSGRWAAIVDSDEAEIWPEWRNKVKHATRRLVLATAMLDAGDLEASAEETLYAVSHTARAVLLKQGAFPLSRPEMVQQLAESGHQVLAELLKELIYATASQRRLTRTHFYVKKLLVHLDKTTYGNYVSERRKILQAKQSKSRHQPIVQ